MEVIESECMQTRVCCVQQGFIVYYNRQKQKRGQRMTELSLTKILEAFQCLSLSQKDYLSQQELISAMSKLNGQTFDQQTFEQLWDQCKLNSKGQAKLAEFVSYILKAEQILSDKLTHAEINYSKHEIYKRPKTNEYAEIQQYKMELEDLNAEKQSIKLSLKIIRNPFLNTKRLLLDKDKSSQRPSLPPTPKNQKSKSDFPQQEPEQYLFDYDSSQTVQTLTKILYWTITLLVLTCFSIFLFSLFVDMVLSAVVLLGFCLQTINRKIVRFNLYLLAFSIVYTFIWLVLYTDKLWYPAKSVEYSSKFSTYINLCIIEIIIGQFIKILLCYYYLTIVQIDEEQVFSVEFGSKTLYMKNDPNVNYPQKNPLIYALRHILNKKPSEEVQPELSV